MSTRKAKPKNKKKPLLSLVMMVKNEAKSIVETIESVRGIIDRWTILDTGSTDGTQDLIRKTMGSLPGRLVEEPFVSYGATRNRVLELEGEQSVFALMLSGDESIVNPGALRAFCEAKRNEKSGAYHVRVELGSSVFDHARLIRQGSGFRYKGSYHEALCHPLGGNLPKEQRCQSRVPDTFVFHDPKHRDVSEQWKRGIVLLLEELASMDESDQSHRARTLFYIAQTYECLGQPHLAAEFYTRRVALPSWPEEDYEAKFRLGRILMRLGSAERAEKTLIEAWSDRPQRAEPLYEIADYYHRLDDHANAALYASMAAQLPFPDAETLFVDRDVYEWKALDLFAVHAYYMSGPIRDAGRAAAVKASAARPFDQRLAENVGHYERTAT